MTRILRASFRRRKNGPNNAHIFGARNCQRQGIEIYHPDRNRETTRHMPGETGRKLAVRLRAADPPRDESGRRFMAFEASQDVATETIVKPAQKSRAKKAA